MINAPIAGPMSMIFRGTPPNKQSSPRPRELWGRMMVAAVEDEASGLQSRAQWTI